MVAFNDSEIYITTRRAGTISNPYISRSESKKIINGKVYITELPSKLDTISVTGNSVTWVKTLSVSPSADQFYVDYENGFLVFNASREGLTNVIEYMGRGITAISASRVFTETDGNGLITETLAGIVTNVNATNDSAVVAEASRVSAENIRISQESGRVTAESARVVNDASKVFRGLYSSGTSYVANNQVVYNSESYICILASTNNLPTNTTYWTKTAASGSMSSLASANGDITVANPTTAPTITSLYNQITAKSASATLTSSERGIIDVTTSTTDRTITLPSAITSGIRYTIRKVDSALGIVTIATTSSQLIDGALTRRIIGQYSSITVLSNGTGWTVLNVEDSFRDIQSAILKHGWNYLLSDQSSPLNLTIKGRTLVNILGKDGNCESLTGWSTTGIASTISTTQKKSGTSSIKFTGDASNASYVSKDFTYPLDTTKQYIVAGLLYIESIAVAGLTVLAIQDVGTGTSRYSTTANIATVGSWQFVYVKVPTSNTLVGTGFRLRIGSASVGAIVGYLDDFRLYELSSADYTALGTTLTATSSPSIDEIFPYVDSVKHVDGAYVRKSGKNLLPPFSEWTLHANAAISESYNLTLVATAINQQTILNGIIKCLPSTTYTISIDSITAGAQIYLTDLNASGGFLALNVRVSYTALSVTFTTGATAASLYLATTNPASGTYVYTNLQLELGFVATAFEPQNNDYAYLPTKLASSIDRTVYDSVYYRDGAYRKLKRMMTDVALDGSLAWTDIGDYTGFKRVRTAISGGVLDSQSISKYEGKILAKASDVVVTVADYARIFSDGYLYIYVSDTDSGFGETLVPSVAEWKSYYFGYKMNNGVFGTNYDGTGTKTWIPWGATDNTGAVTVVPTTVSTAISGGTYDYYRLSYQLAATYVEEEIIVGAEGSIGLHAGGNQIEIGEGVVVREVATPYLSGSTYYLNTLTFTTFDYRTSKILAIYRDGELDIAWTIDTSAPYGNERAYISSVNYDPTATYTVTYTKLDKYLSTSNVIDITGEYATTDRTVLDMTVQNVTDAQTSISTINSRLTNEFTKSGGKRIQTGTSSGVVATLGTPVTVAVTFTYAYTSAPVVNVSKTGVTVGTAGYVYAEPESITTTGFVLRFNAYVAQTISVNWEAIGL